MHNEKNEGNMMNDSDMYITSLEHHIKLNNDAAHMELDNGKIEPLAHDHGTLGVIERDWAENVEEESGFIEDGRYLPANYTPVPQPAPILLPPTFTLKYTPPRTHYARAPTWYVPSHSHFTPRYPHFTCPQHTQCLPCKN
jgi:hypothetical protein